MLLAMGVFLVIFQIVKWYQFIHFFLLYDLILLNFKANIEKR